MKRAAIISRLASARFWNRPIAIGLIVSHIGAAIPIVAARERPTSEVQPPPPPQVTVNRTVPTVTPPPARPVFSSPPTTAEITRARVFSEPLVPLGATPTGAENAALAAAIDEYIDAHDPEAWGTFNVFLTAHPMTAWRASLLANLGSLYRQTGYLTRALNAWNEAWQLTKSATDLHGRAVADFAIGEHLELRTKPGQVDQLSPRLSEITDRDVRGSAASKVQMAKEGLWFLTHHHAEASGSGPVALETVLVATGTATPAKRQALGAHHIIPEGTTLPQLKAMAEEVGFSAQMVFREAAVDVPVPSIVHFKSNHFAALVQRDGNRYLVRDAILGGDMWISTTALADEGSGFFLILSSASLPTGLRWATTAKTNGVVGHCLPGGPSPIDPLTLTMLGPPANPCGMPSYRFHPVRAALYIDDVPILCSGPRGPSASFRVTYDHRNQLAPQMPTFGNLGPKWTFSWMSYVADQVSSNTPVRVVLQTPGSEQYAVQDFVPSAPHWRSKAVLVRTSSNPIRYERRLRDGSVEVFEQSEAPWRAVAACS